jgi:hypothetical protein
VTKARAKNTTAIDLAKEITLALIAKSPPKAEASPTSKGEYAGKIFKAVLKQVVEAMEDCEMLILSPDDIAAIAQTAITESQKMMQELGIKSGQSNDHT